MNFATDIKNQLFTYYDKIILLLPKLVFAIVVCSVLLFVMRTIRKRLIRFLTHRADDKLLMNFFNSVFSIVNGILVALLFLYIIGQGRIASSILGAAGVSAFVIGFALKDIGENFLAGVIMAFDRPFRLGDTVKTGEVEGTITEMSLRDTHIKTFDGKDVYVPNGQIIKKPLYNYTIDGFLRKSFVLGVDYGTDLDVAREIIIDAVAQVPGVQTEPKHPRTIISEFGTSTVNITVQYWVNTFDKVHSGIAIQNQIMRDSYNALDKAGVNMPGNVVELKNYTNGNVSV